MTTASDSPRWCGQCNGYGDHHTDRHPGIQAEVGAWHRRELPGGTDEKAALIVAEETGELCRAVLKRAQGIRGSHEMWTVEIRKEAADVQIALLWVAEHFGFDLGEATSERWSEVRERVWAS